MAALEDTPEGKADVRSSGLEKCHTQSVSAGDGRVVTEKGSNLAVTSAASQSGAKGEGKGE